MNSLYSETVSVNRSYSAKSSSFLESSKDSCTRESLTKKRITNFQMEVLEKPSIKCSEVKKLLYSYSENELVSPLEAKIEEHQRSCSKCDSLIKSYISVKTIAGDMHSEPVEIGVQKRLRAKLNEKLNLNLKVDLSRIE